jgi:replication factor A1
MDLEQIVQHILLVRQDLTREEVLKKIYEKKRSAEGYFLDEAAARIVAFELGVEIPKDETETAWTELQIEKLVSGLNDVTVTGRVITVYPVQTFSRPDLTEGKVACLLIADKTGTLKAVLWDYKATLAETGKIASGKIIRVLHGYVREGLDGKLELHVGTRGEIQISPPDIAESEYPPITSFMEKISSITGKHRKANVLGVVQRVYPASEFKRADGTYGKVRRLQLRDETGQITVVFWNKRVDELGDVETGDHLRIMNARVKELASGLVELHVERATQIEKVTEKAVPIPAFPTALTKIKKLKPKLRAINVLARIVGIEDIREFKRPNGEIRQVSTLHIRDETGSIQLNLWNEKAKFSKKAQLGDIVLVKGAYTRQRFGKLELNLGTKGTITLNPLLAEAEKLPPYEPKKTKKIVDIKEEGGPFTIEATVASTPELREVTTSRNEKVKVTSFSVSDNTGKISVSLWREHAETAKNLPLGTRILFKNIYAKRGFANQLELTTRASTKIEILSNSKSKLENMTNKR